MFFWPLPIPRLCLLNNGVSGELRPVVRCCARRVARTGSSAGRRRAAGLRQQSMRLWLSQG
eukprot:6762520-Alexandrium_andersonii.AAC.1